MAKLVSKVYGDALFESALESKRVDEMFEEVLSLKDVLDTNPELQKMMDNPKVAREDKESVIETVFRGKLSNEIVELMKLMIAKGRYSELDGVLDYFVAMVKEVKKIGVAAVTTATEITDAQKAAVEKRLLETTKYESFEMSYAVDPELIGGMVIRIGDRVVDTSIKTKLYELTKSLRAIQV